MTDTFASGLIGIGVPTLRELRAGVLSLAPSAASDDAVLILREAGFAGGDALFDAFGQWLDEQGLSAFGGSMRTGLVNRDAGELSVGDFSQHAARFFQDAFWGTLTFATPDGQSYAEVTIADGWESEVRPQIDSTAAEATGVPMPGCHITTGMLAAFFGRIAGYSVAVLETECRSAGGSHCCFAMGNADVVHHEWEKLS